jgi:glutamyl-tRNA reductase
MNIIGITINHHTAPVELREALHLNEDEVRSAISEFKGKLLSEGLVLSTCNRTEIYGIPLRQDITQKEIQEFLLGKKNNDTAKDEHFRLYSSREALGHLFEVISGIDSLLVGDNQIYKQVKESFQISEDMQFSGFLMKRIFDHAVKVGKRAITETEISAGAVTVSYAAVQLIEKIFSALNKKSALVIGAGETGQIAARHLREKNIGKLVITNRTIERAEKLAESLNAEILPFVNYKNSLHEFDIILSATSADSYILTRNDIKSAMKKRNYNSMVLMDIAIPRDIEPNVRDLDYVFYHDIDALNIIVDQNLQKRKNEIPKVKEIIREELNSFFSWYSSLEASPTIKILRDWFENIRAEEVGKNINRFSPEDREKLEVITKRIINKLLHNPTIELKKMMENGSSDPAETAMKIHIIREIFGVDKDKNTGSKF